MDIGSAKPTEEERAREADRRDIRYPMRLSRDGESAEIRLGFIYLGSMAEEWWRYAEKLIEDLTAQGQQAGFDMSSDKGEDVELAGAWWFSRTVTYAKGGEVVGHRVMLWRVVEGELVELVLDDGVWSEETPDGMKRMIGRAG